MHLTLPYTRQKEEEDEIQNKNYDIKTWFGWELIFCVASSFWLLFIGEHLFDDDAQCLCVCFVFSWKTEK